MSYSEKYWIEKIRIVARDQNVPWVNRLHTIKIIDSESEKVCFGVNGVQGRFHTTKEFLLNYRPANTSS